MLRICNWYKRETKSREMWAFFEVFEVHGSLKRRSAKAVTGNEQGLGWEVRVNHSSENFHTIKKIIVYDDSCLAPFQNS